MEEEKTVNERDERGKDDQGPIWKKKRRKKERT